MACEGGTGIDMDIQDERDRDGGSLILPSGGVMGYILWTDIAV